MENMFNFNRDVVNYAYLGNFRAVTLTDYGCRILIDTRNKQHLKIISHGVYEKAVAWAISEHLNSDEVFVDVGANIGYFTLLGCKIVGPKGKVYALEPNPVIYEMMETSVFANSFGKRCETINIAAFKSDGELELTWDSAGHGGGRLVTHDDVILDENKTLVKLQKLDKILENNNEKISVIKIDTEGSEPFILEGATHILENNPDCTIIAEWSPRFVKSRGYDFDKYVDYLYDTFESIELLAKVGVANKIDKQKLINTRHGNIILKGYKK
jgi:FkbM family methyltransferase